MALSKCMGSDSPERPWEESLEEGFEILAEMWRSDRAFHSVWLAIQNTAELTEAREQYREMSCWTSPCSTAKTRTC